LLAAASSSNGQFPTGGGQLLWPAAGPMTSAYGYRTHPIFGDTRLHAGIDIGAAYGAPVIASDSGSVVFAGVMSGYGNAIVIDHGGGLATTYNHLSAFTVSSGQSVRRGAQIGAVGCTGYCTGPHLHFEVRVDGAPVDPMPYLQ
jgi:murein DD-endopeptidase MepM/ murein hydrolase activator NlpD